MPDDSFFKDLRDFLAAIPGVDPSIGHGLDDTGNWWLKFSIDIDHPLAWNVIQELGHVLNYLSLAERLPTVFKPVSPPPSLNGGPRDFLSWVIECSDKDFRPADCAEYLEGRLPRPVNDLTQWQLDEEGS